jgi:hypothetical protein
MTGVTSSVTPDMFLLRETGPTMAVSGEAMDSEKPHVILCFWCQRRITPEQLRSGRHDHVDVLERIEYDLAVNNGGD